MDKEKRFGLPIECYECKLRRYIYNVDLDEQEKEEYVRKQEELMESLDEGIGPDEFVKRLKVEYAKHVPTRDYRDIKDYYNRKMLELLPKLREDAERSDDPLLYALKLAYIGNYIDFDSYDEVSEERYHGMLEDIEGKKIDMDVYETLKEELGKARSLVYLLDNCGEIVLDRLFMEQIGKRYPDVKMTALVRGAEVINDVTLDDAEQVNLSAVCDVRSNGLVSSSTSFAKMPEDIRKLVEDADLIISKGQANGESLKGCGYNIYYILMSKCERFARMFGVNKWDGVLARERKQKSS